MIIWLNGKQDNCLTLPHRGLAYGDGLFETIRIEQKTAVLLERHLTRLSNSANALDFTIQSALPEITRATTKIINTLESNASGVLKIMLLRSHQGRGYGHKSDNDFDLIHEFYPSDTLVTGWQLDGISLGCCQSSVSMNPTLAGHKHLNRLDSVIAKKECSDHGWDDGVMFAGDQVIETTSANIFAVKDNVLYTPKIEKAGVKGISRDLVLEYSESCFKKVIEKELYLEDIIAADFIFITNAVIIARPVSQLIFGKEIKAFNIQNESFSELVKLLSGVLKR